MIIKIKIKEMREFLGISINKLAEDTGIDRRRLAKIENKEIALEQILFIEMLVIADCLDVSILSLYEVTDIEVI